MVLESLCHQHSYGRYTIVSFDPVERLVCDRLQPIDPFEALQSRAAAIPKLALPAMIPFAGGWIGYLAYEAGRFLERLPGQAKGDLDLPFACFGLYDTAAIFDHACGQWHVAGVQLPECPGRPALDRRLQHLEALLSEAAETEPPPFQVVATPADAEGGRRAYVAGVRRILEHIRAGDVYQANLSYRFAVPLRSAAVDVYRALCAANPAAYMAFLDAGDHQVLCSSPELFLQLRDRDVLTRPIKGTSPRSQDPLTDAALARRLTGSAKDLAELAMIVDLLRNDLGRVCATVEASWPPLLESYRTVHHLVADVRGTLGTPPLATGGWVPHASSAIELLRATFPGGSITGAPKIRAMEIIDELEPVARGPYCGSIGYIGLDGSMTMNIAIRTMTLKGAVAYIHSGSGIVVDSDPHAEYDEIKAKAQGLFAALTPSPSATHASCG